MGVLLARRRAAGSLREVDDAERSDPGSGATGTDLPVVYWRPGCFFCNRLLRAFDRAGVRFERRNIWEDDEARAFVRAHNRGDETVPTVAFGGDVQTNPDPRRYVAQLAAERPDLVEAVEEGPGGRLSSLFRR
ncbi:NrdH-redoxin [Acidimicrobiaceae bacterium USS-CC1]|uniref:NrdH-redoxin n=1 Tax=Acidiferrimicrobium australe TaxID=2664430 RepID=A0ABW9R010_9ACTN|nr:NrdH-redoxin [Acidiferrimicrobium australe]